MFTAIILHKTQGHGSGGIPPRFRAPVSVMIYFPLRFT